jgi:transcription elongation factor S-II
MTSRYSHLISADPVVFRANMRNHFQTKFGLDERQAANAEIGAFRHALDEANRAKIVKKWENKNFANLYVERLRSLWTNFGTAPDLLQKYKSGEIGPEALATMTHLEMNPDRWRTYIEKRMKRESQSTEERASTDMFTCKKCRSKKCSYYELQTRSADEPTTIFITCLDCGKNWKQ